MCALIFNMKFFSALLLLLCLIFPLPTFAAPYFYINTSTSAVQNVNKTISLYLNTDGSTLNVAQIVVNFDPTYLSPVSLSTLSSKCSIWSPADPSLGLGNNFATPGFADGNKAVFSCGFSSPGYLSGSSTGDLIARLTFKPLLVGTTTLTFSNPTFLSGPGNSVSAGASPDYDLTTHVSTQAAQATPTPTPNPSSTPTSSSGTSQPSESVSEDDLEFVEISGGGGGGGTTTDSDNVTLTQVDEDDTIPNPPDLERRPSATPFQFSLLSTDSTPQDSDSDSGDVLSAQTLRELLIPGKSKADKTVVMINLISTVTFITLLGLIIWRLISISRMNKLRAIHMQELLNSELATLESKLGAFDGKDANKRIKQELFEVREKISEQSKG